MLQVTLAYESIVLYMCEGKVLMDKGALSTIRFKNGPAVLEKMKM